MCGIVGYAGNEAAAPIILEGLNKLEYRGYDSTGICTYDNSNLEIHKAKGRLQVLSDMVEGGKNMTSTLGMGHTRWATHGVPSDTNAHPHLSADGRIALIHNGIVENYLPLKEELLAQGVEFKSETDTEVAANLLAQCYRQTGDFFKAMLMTLDRVRGSYAFVAMCADYPDTIIAARQHSPLILGYGDGCNFLASDVPAILRHTRDVSYLNDGDVVVITADSANIYDRQGKPVSRPVEHIQWDMADAEKGGYEHFMLKEIYEQPSALEKTISPRIKDGKIAFEGSFLTKEYLEKLKRIYIVACGSAYYVGCVSKYTLETQCRIPVEPMLASEFRYCDPVIDENCLAIVISQSGETADTLAALKEARARGARTLAIVNVVGSSIAREADHVIYTWAGPEIAVATTKGYSTQLVMMDMLSLFIADTLGKVTQADYSRLLGCIQALPQQLEQVLADENMTLLEDYARRFSGVKDVFFIGRNVDSATCLEGSLKLKEIAYIHSDSYAAGELKHGPLALIVEDTLVVALATGEALLEKTVSNIKEVKARGGKVLGLTTQAMAEELGKVVDYTIITPVTDPLYQPTLSVVPLQVFAYYVAKELGQDIDKPRNLAKSVTVE